MTAERSTRLTLWLAVSALVLPFVWIDIGPQGLAHYGPDVPDIYILGATILGKDRNDGGISFAMRFQLVMSLCFILCTYVAFLRSRKGSSVQSVAVVQMQLLLMFPFWLCLYVDGVINNSDGAASDLRVYPHIGFVFYLLLWPLTINTFEKGGKGRIRFTAP